MEQSTNHIVLVERIAPFRTLTVGMNYIVFYFTISPIRNSILLLENNGKIGTTSSENYYYYKIQDTILD